jgi:hypothetical protein
MEFCGLLCNTLTITDNIMRRKITDELETHLGGNDLSLIRGNISAFAMEGHEYLTS